MAPFGTGLRSRGVHRASIVAVVAAASISAAGCGGGGGGGGAGSGLPAPPSGKATIGGKLVKNGTPVANETISLSVAGKRRATTKTTTTGQFTFERVDPGKYTIGTGLIFRGAEVASGSSCSVPGYQALVLHGTTSTGEHIAIASLESKQFQANAGDRVVKNITVTCKGA